MESFRTSSLKKLEIELLHHFGSKESGGGSYNTTGWAVKNRETLKRWTFS